MEKGNWIGFIIGYVFVTSGIMKLVIPEFKGMFAALGLPFPELTLFLVGIFEVACGMLIAGRIYARYATIPLIVIMITAILLTKVPVLYEDGILKFAFEARLDIVMLVLLALVAWKKQEKIS